MVGIEVLVCNSFPIFNHSSLVTVKSKISNHLLCSLPSSSSQPESKKNNIKRKNDNDKDQTKVGM